MGVCENCRYFPGFCEYGDIDTNKCIVAQILECREISQNLGFEKIYKKASFLVDMIPQNRTARELMDEIRMIQYYSNQRLPKWAKK